MYQNLQYLSANNRNLQTIILFLFSNSIRYVSHISWYKALCRRAVHVAVCCVMARGIVYFILFYFIFQGLLIISVSSTLSCKCFYAPSWCYCYSQRNILTEYCNSQRASEAGSISSQKSKCQWMNEGRKISSINRSVLPAQNYRHGIGGKYLGTTLKKYLPVQGYTSCYFCITTFKPYCIPVLPACMLPRCAWPGYS